MVYKCGEYEISVEQIDGFGKNPGLWIKTEPNTLVKVASFGSKEKADTFEQYLTEFLIGHKKP